MVKLRVRSGESIQEAVRRFRKLCEAQWFAKRDEAQGILRKALRETASRRAQAAHEGPQSDARLSPQNRDRADAPLSRRRPETVPSRHARCAASGARATRPDRDPVGHGKSAANLGRTVDRSQAGASG